MQNSYGISEETLKKTSEYIEKIGERKFKIGEGIVLLQGSQLHFIKVPVIRNIEKMQNICIEALNR